MASQRDLGTGFQTLGDPVPHFLIVRVFLILLLFLYFESDERITEASAYRRSELKTVSKVA